MTQTLLVAADGGGTACRMVLVQGAARHQITLGPANVASDRAGAMATLHQGLDQLAQMAGISRATLAGAQAVFGLAGVMNAQDATDVAADLPFDRVRVVDDRVTSVAGALGAEDGAVAALGTGSFAGRQRGGTCRFVGGWGMMLGDEGSGAWLGRAVLAAVLRAQDGLDPDSDLLRDIQAGFPGGAPDIVAFAATARASDLAALAPGVVAAAAAGDATGRRLMQSGADYITQALQALGWHAPEPICLLGGLGEAYQPYLSPDLFGHVRPPLGTALDGALDLARQQAGGGA